MDEHNDDEQQPEQHFAVNKLTFISDLLSLSLDKPDFVKNDNFRAKGAICKRSGGRRLKQIFLPFRIRCAVLPSDVEWDERQIKITFIGL